MNSILVIARRTVSDRFRSCYTDHDPYYNDSILRFPEPSKRFIDLRPKMGLKGMAGSMADPNSRS